jgi:hypothetical protein
MIPPQPQKRYRCRFCGTHFNAWLPAIKAVDGAMLLYHLGQQHRTEIGRYLDQMRSSNDIGTRVGGWI